MLATPRCTDRSTHAFLPHVSSPLSPRSANIYGRYPVHMSSNEAEKQQPHQQSTATVKREWSKRAVTVKKAPSPKPDELKERRRNLFLRKVREGREDRRWEQRGEDIMRLDFAQRQRAWEAEQAREAPLLPSDPIEEEDEQEDEAVYDLPSSSNAMPVSQPASQQPMPEEEFDEVLQREEEEMEALLSYMSGGDQEQERWLSGSDAQAAAGNLWNDDDDYDALFSEVMDEGTGTVSGQQVDHTLHTHEGGEEMDLS